VEGSKKQSEIEYGFGGLGEDFLNKHIIRFHTQNIQSLMQPEIFLLILPRHDSFSSYT
jgi:hypothetical protein